MGLLLLIPQPSDQFQVGTGVRVVRGLLQGPLIGGNRLVQPAQAGQGVGPVVIGLGSVLIGQVGQCPGIVAPAVAGGGPPGRVLKQGRRGVRLPGGQPAGPLLVGPLPQVAPTERPTRLGGQPQDQDQHGQEPAAPEGQGSDGQQGEQEPGTLLAPLVRLQTLLFDQPGPVRRRHEGLSGGDQGAGIPIARVQVHIATLTLPGQGLQGDLVESGHGDGTGAITHEAPVLTRDRRPLGRADPEHREPMPPGGQVAGGRGGGRSGSGTRTGPGRVRDGIGDQDHLAPRRAGLGQQFARHRQGAPRAPETGHREQVRAEARDLVGDGPGITGQGGDDVGFRAEGDQGDLTLPASREQVQDLEARTRQTRGGHVGGIHARREVEKDDAFGRGGEDRLGQPLPDRTGQGDHTHQPGQGEQDQRQAARPARLTHQQVGQEVGIHQTLPGGTRPARPPESDPEPDQDQQQGHQGEEPVGTQKVQFKRHRGLPTAGPTAMAGRSVH